MPNLGFKNTNIFLRCYHSKKCCEAQHDGQDRDYHIPTLTRRVALIATECGRQSIQQFVQPNSFVASVEWKICKTNLCSKLRFYLDNFIPIPLKVCADNISRWWCCKKDKAKAAMKFCGSSQRNAGKLHQKIKNEKQKVPDDGCYESGIVWNFFVLSRNRIPSAKVLATEINNVLREILFRRRNMKNYFRNKSDFSYRWHEFEVAGSRTREQSEGAYSHSNALVNCLRG